MNADQRIRVTQQVIMKRMTVCDDAVPQDSLFHHHLVTLSVLRQGIEWRYSYWFEQLFTSSHCTLAVGGEINVFNLIIC